MEASAHGLSAHAPALVVVAHEHAVEQGPRRRDRRRRLALGWNEELERARASSPPRVVGADGECAGGHARRGPPRVRELARVLAGALLAELRNLLGRERGTGATPSAVARREAAVAGAERVSRSASILSRAAAR